MLLLGCSTTKKLKQGEFLLTKNSYEYTDGKIFDDEIPNNVSQKPNKKSLFGLPIGLPIGLWSYNLVNPKYDDVLDEFLAYPSDLRTPKLRDSLYIKYGHPELVGKSLFLKPFFYKTIGQTPVIWNLSKTETSAESIRKFLIYRGYWDAQVKYQYQLDSTKKKAQVSYQIMHKDPTYIKEYFYNIPDKNIKRIYDEHKDDILVKTNDILNQKTFENEVKRITELMRNSGYYKFNITNDEIYFNADSLKSRKQVPVTMEIHKDEKDSPYKVATIGKIEVGVVENQVDFKKSTVKDSLRGIDFYKNNEDYTTRSLWLPILSKKGDVYNQKNLDLTKRNLLAMNNFSILKAEDNLRNGGKNAPNDSIIDIIYILKPLDKYDWKTGTDLHYSEVLNWGISPSVDLTTRNIFGNAENLVTTVSGIFGRVVDTKNPDSRILAYELSAQAALKFPRLLVPFKKYYKLIPKRYTPTSTISLGISNQSNLGLGRVNFNGGLTYAATVNDVVSHQLTLLNTQLSLTRNKDAYYDFFPNDEALRSEFANLYLAYDPTLANYPYTKDELSYTIINDNDYIATLNDEQRDKLNDFQQSLYNKDRQTQDVLISSLIYNFTYNEIGKKEFRNPFYFNGKVEFAGNIFSLFRNKEINEGVLDNKYKTIFDIPYSQFAKFDIDVRKYYTFFGGKHTLALRQFIGIGIPYGNSEFMPYVRSYFNGGSNDIRAWIAFGGLGPADSQLDERVRRYVMQNMKLTTSVEYRFPFNDMFSGAIFTDAGNIWSLKDYGLGDQFKIGKFIPQMGVGSGFGIRMNIAYLTIRIDMAYKMYDPNLPIGNRWRISYIKPLQPTFNFAFTYPF